ncbi:MAG: ABC transporter permease [Patescibacteria group bacterium]
MIKLFIANLKMMVRGKQALFWSLVFPLMFTVIFGFFFGSGTTSAGTVVLINNSNSQIAKSFQTTAEKSELFKIKTDVDESQAKDLLKKAQISAIVVVPENFGNMAPNSPKEIKVIDDPANAQTNGIVIGFVNQFLTIANFQALSAQPIFSVVEEKNNDRDLTYFDFVLMGLIGLALMNASVQGIAITMANYREDKILKRITTTPLRTWKFVMAEVLSRLVLNVFQISLILIIGIYFFHAHIYGNIGLIFLFSLLGGLLFQSIGFMVSSIAKSTDAAQGMSVAITIPMMFLAGVFFPIDQLPKWLYSIVQYLPLAPLLRMIRQIGIEAASPFTNPMNIIIVLAWIAVTLTISMLKFRLTDE